jgi:uncharacterized protein (TIGR02646 family)
VALPRSVLGALSSYRATLDALVMREQKRSRPQVGAVVEAAWRARRSGSAVRAVEAALRAMASGIERCMYCEDSHGCDVEHFRPKVPRPTGTFVWRNLLWVCATCNRQKNSGFSAAILDPTRDDPSDHLVLSLSTGRLVPRDESRRGAATLRVMKRLSSDPALIRGRLNAVKKLRVFLARYDADVAAGDLAAADEIRRTLVEEPFSAVFATVLRASEDPGARDVLGDALVDVISRHPAMHGWLAAADRARIAAAQPSIAALASRVRVAR